MMRIQPAARPRRGVHEHRHGHRLGRRAAGAMLALAMTAAVGALGSFGGAAAWAAGRGVARADGAAGSAATPAICGQTGVTGQTPVDVASLGVRFVFPNHWLCVPGTGPLPATVLVAERLDSEINLIVAALRHAAVGGFYLLPGAKIPCQVAVDQAGTGTLPDTGIWSQQINGDARASGATLAGLHVSLVSEPGGRFLNATLTESNAGGATYFVDEYLASVDGKLVLAAFEGSPVWHNTVVIEARALMSSFR
jgi:hypothetical protein